VEDGAGQIPLRSRIRQEHPVKTSHDLITNR
jgi:hypothetical protein